MLAKISFRSVPFYFLLLFISCKQSGIANISAEDSIQIVDNKKIEIDSINNVQVKYISSENKANTNWFKRKAFTYQLQETMTDNNMIDFIGRINDEIQINTNYYLLKVEGTYYNPFYSANVYLDSVKFNELNRKIIPLKRSQKICFIVVVDRVIPPLTMDSAAILECQLIDYYVYQ